jgi:hypothetical protein
MQFCVQQWYDRNNMSLGGGTTLQGKAIHTHMKILPAPVHFDSPQYGWSFTNYDKSPKMLPNERPLTYHPFLKNMMYGTPEYVREHWRECTWP